MKKKTPPPETREEARKRIIAGFVVKIKAMADAIPDGWMELTLAPKEGTDQKEVKVKIARIPFERWLRGAINHRRDEWPNVAPMGLKTQMDDRNHSDWWLSTGIPLEYAYRKRSSLNDFLEPGDEGYVPPDPKEEEWRDLAKRLEYAAWAYRYSSTENRERNSIFLVSSKKEVDGRIMHVRTVEDIPAFVEQAQRWKEAFNSQNLIAVVPDCSILYDTVIRHAAAIITQVGSKAAHLVKVAREDKIPVILCPDAFKEFFEYEHIAIQDKRIRTMK